jgi:hypothetical protein
MITTEKAHPSGAWIVSALVADGGAPFYQRRTYMGYSKREAVAMFRDSLTRDGLRIVEA